MAQDTKFLYVHIVQALR